MNEPAANKTVIPTWQGLLFIAMAGAAIMVWVWKASPAGRQAARMAACQIVIDRETPEIRSDPRWEDVAFRAYTRETLLVYGEVETEEDAHELFKLVQPWSAEVPVEWRIHVRAWYPPEGDPAPYPDWWPDTTVIGSWQE